MSLQEPLCPLMRRLCETEDSQGLGEERMGFGKGCAKAFSEEWPQLWILGTGSAAPSINRNVSGSVLRLSKDLSESEE